MGEYRYLAGSRRARGTLWEGPDHLLYVEWTGFPTILHETLKRLDYRNILAVTYAKTRWGWVHAAWLGLALAGFGWKAMTASNFGARSFYQILSGAFFLGLLVHVFRGPTCVCTIQTAVGVHRIRALRRVSAARLFVRRLSELCLLHQGGEELPLSVLASGESDFRRGWARDGQRKPPAFPGSRLVVLSLAMLVLSGVLLVAKPFSQSGVLFWGILVSDLAGGILVLAALARNARFSLPRTLRGALWTGTVLSAVHGVIGVVIYLWMVTASFVSAGREGRAPTPLGNVGVDYLEESYRRLHGLTFLEMGKAGWILVGLGVAHAVVGLLGLGSLWFGAPRVSGGEGEGGLRIPPPLPDGVPGRGAAPGEEGLL